MKIINVQEVYQKNKDLKREDIQNLLEWAEKQPHLPPITELHLALFFHSCYYSMELTKTTIENFYTYRVHCPEFFNNLNPNNHPLKLSLNNILFMGLPELTSEGYKVVFCQLLSEDASDYLFSDHVKIFDMAVMQWLFRQGPAEGLVIVVDFAVIGFGHLMKIHVLTMKKILMYLQEALPVRLQSIHIINVGAVMDGLMALIKPFLNKKVSESFFFHDSKYEKIYDYIPKRCFPDEYGGSAGSIAALHDTMMSQFFESVDFLKEAEKWVADDSKRLGKPRKVDDIFGIEGSFKKLDID